MFNALKYIVVGGNPLLVYSQGLRVLGLAKDEDEVQQIVDQHYYECYGIMMIIDAKTGLKANIDINVDLVDPNEQFSPQEQSHCI